MTRAALRHLLRVLALTLCVGAGAALPALAATTAGGRACTSGSTSGCPAVAAWASETASIARSAPSDRVTIADRLPAPVGAPRRFWLRAQTRRLGRSFVPRHIALSGLGTGASSGTVPGAPHDVTSVQPVQGLPNVVITTAAPRAPPIIG